MTFHVLREQDCDIIAVVDFCKKRAGVVTSNNNAIQLTIGYAQPASLHSGRCGTYETKTQHSHTESTNLLSSPGNSCRTNGVPNFIISWNYLASGSSYKKAYSRPLHVSSLWSCSKHKRSAR